MKFVSGKGRKHYMKRRQCWLLEIYHFSTISPKPFPIDLLKVKILLYRVKDFTVSLFQTIMITFRFQTTSKTPKAKQEDHDGPISLTRVPSSKGLQSYVPTCDPHGGANLTPGASNEQTWLKSMRRGYIKNIKALGLTLSEKKNSEICRLCFYAQTCEPHGRTSPDPRGIV